VAREVEAIIRAKGAIPGTIAICGGKIRVGLEEDELAAIANRDDVVKASLRDLAIIAARGGWAATTVASTAHLAAMAGIECFATGGLGGVHPGANESFDESADLTTLSRTPVTVISAGVKSILDIAATLERIETLGISILGYKTNRFPGFYLKDSGFALEYRVDSAGEVASIMRSRVSDGALLVANPAPHPMAQDVHDQLLNEALDAAKSQAIVGKAVTPYILEYFHSKSAGESLRVNTEIIKSNAALAAEIAVEYKSTQRVR
jgi:pseudouridine-5'-phosphate glycosidase